MSPISVIPEGIATSQWQGVYSYFWEALPCPARLLQFYMELGNDALGGNASCHPWEQQKHRHDRVPSGQLVDLSLGFKTPVLWFLICHALLGLLETKGKMHTPGRFLPAVPFPELLLPFTLVRHTPMIVITLLLLRVHSILPHWPEDFPQVDPSPVRIPKYKFHNLNPPLSLFLDCFSDSRITGVTPTLQPQSSLDLYLSPEILTLT